MRRKTEAWVYAMTLALALASLTAVVKTASAQRQNPDITRQQLENFDRFLDSHPQIRAELTQNPNLVNDPRYIQDRPELRDFLATHDLS